MVTHRLGRLLTTETSTEEEEDEEEEDDRWVMGSRRNIF
jgi:hypothetical protein